MNFKSPSLSLSRSHALSFFSLLIERPLPAPSFTHPTPEHDRTPLHKAIQQRLTSGAAELSTFLWQVSHGEGPFYGQLPFRVAAAQRYCLFLGLQRAHPDRQLVRWGAKLQARCSNIFSSR